MTDFTSKPWERQQGEPEKAFNGFRTFLYLPPPRTYKRTAEALGVSLEHIKAWGRRYDWQLRAQQYDAFMVGRVDEARMSAVKMFQDQVVSDEVEDYQRLRRIWQSYMDDTERNMDSLDAGELLDRVKKLTAIRTVIDQMARKAASLPNSYRSAELPNNPQALEDDPVMILTLDGPKILEGTNDQTG